MKLFRLNIEFCLVSGVLIALGFGLANQEIKDRFLDQDFGTGGLSFVKLGCKDRCSILQTEITRVLLVQSSERYFNSNFAGETIPQTRVTTFTVTPTLHPREQNAPNGQDRLRAWVAS